VYNLRLQYHNMGNDTEQSQDTPAIIIYNIIILLVDNKLYAIFPYIFTIVYNVYYRYKSKSLLILYVQTFKMYKGNGHHSRYQFY